MADAVAHLPFGVMSSYFYWEPEDDERMRWSHRFEKPTFIDSGAFSALTLNAQIDLQQYTDFVLARRQLFDLVAALDVVHDATASMRNWQWMMNHGVPDAIPCFHVGEPWEYLRDLSSAPRLGLGVAAMQSRKAPIETWLNTCFEKLAEWGSAALVHGYGITSTEWMRMFPWSSIDSSSWFMGSKYGRLFTRDGDRIVTYGKATPPRDLKLVRTWRTLLPWGKTNTSEAYFGLLRYNIETFSTYVQHINDARERVNGSAHRPSH